MTQILNEKQILIIPLLARLREFNPNIGAYEKSILKDDFNYTVKLNNGTIEIETNLIDDFKAASHLLSKRQLQAAALKFVPSVIQADSDVSVRKENKWLVYGLLLVIVLLLLLFQQQRAKAAVGQKLMVSMESRYINSH